MTFFNDLKGLHDKYRNPGGETATTTTIHFGSAADPEHVRALTFKPLNDGLLSITTTKMTDELDIDSLTVLYGSNGFPLTAENNAGELYPEEGEALLAEVVTPLICDPDTTDIYSIEFQ